jgi:hypothetical protein
MQSPSRGEKKNLKSGFGVEPRFSSFLKLKKKKDFLTVGFFASCFMETAGCLMFPNNPNRKLSNFDLFVKNKSMVL